MKFAQSKEKASKRSCLQFRQSFSLSCDEDLSAVDGRSKSLRALQAQSSKRRRRPKTQAFRNHSVQCSCKGTKSCANATPTTTVSGPRVCLSRRDPYSRDTAFHLGSHSTRSKDRLIPFANSSIIYANRSDTHGIEQKPHLHSTFT